MADPLIVEDGSGKPDADSYVETTDVDTYLGNYYSSSHTWFLADQDQQFAWCRQGTQYIDGTYQRRWLSDRKYDTQALDWPREQFTDRDGFWVDGMPKELLEATMESIRRLAEGVSLVNDPNSGTSSPAKIVVGPIMVDERSSQPFVEQKNPEFDQITKIIYRIILGSEQPIMVRA